MFAFRPLKVWRVNQPFGANRVCVDLATGSHYVDCDGSNPPNGYKSVYGAKGHEGLDLYAPRWTPFYFCLGGVVIEKVQDDRRGWGVGVLHSVGTGMFRRYYKSRYWHLCGIDVDLGEIVKTGDFGGYCDNTGISTDDHLHFEIGTCDATGGNYVPINPETVIFPTFALDAKSILARMREQLALMMDRLADITRYGK